MTYVYNHLFLCIVKCNTCLSPPLPLHLQVHGVSMRTAVYLVRVPTEVFVALSLGVATPVPALLATQVLAASMTQMNVLPHHLYARIRERVLTPLAPTSENLI